MREVFFEYECEDGKFKVVEAPDVMFEVFVFSKMRDCWVSTKELFPTLRDAKRYLMPKEEFYEQEPEYVNRYCNNCSHLLFKGFVHGDIMIKCSHCDIINDIS